MFKLFILSICCLVLISQKSFAADDEIDDSNNAIKKSEANCEEIRKILNNPEVEGDYRKTYEASLAKCLTELSEVKKEKADQDIAREQKKKTLQEDASKQSKAISKCEEDKYENCYKGVKWGDDITTSSLSSCGSWLRDVQNPSTSSKCDPLFRKDILNAFKNIDSGLYWGMTDECNLLVLNNRLIGFYYYQKHTDDEFLFLKGKMKKKYGASIKETKCDKNPVLKWENVNGLDIFMTKDLDNSNYDGKYNILIKYIHTNSLNKVIADHKKNVEKKKVEEEDKSIEVLGKGL